MEILLSIGLLVACSGPRPDRQPDDAGPDGAGPEAGTRVYDVQIHMTEEKKQAARVLGRTVKWWENQPSSERPPLVRGAPSSDEAVTIEWKVPFYRVRLGPFATRWQAEAVLSAARSTFPDAFVAPDRIESP